MELGSEVILHISSLHLQHYVFNNIFLRLNSWIFFAPDDEDRDQNQFRE